jgi:hypothetical protein
MKNDLSIKLIGCAVLLMMAFTGLQAQDATTTTSTDDYNSHARFGVRGGVVIARQTFENGDLDDNAKSKFGADLAIMFNLPIGDGVFMLQPELHWMQKGSVIDDINSNEEITNSLNYIELPVLLRLNFGESAKIFAIGGPSVGYLLSGQTGDDDIDREDFEDLEYGLHLGLGVGIGAFEIDVRYMAGLSDISAVDGDLSEVRNSAFGAGLTLKF